MMYGVCQSKQKRCLCDVAILETLIYKFYVLIIWYRSQQCLHKFIVSNLSTWLCSCISQHCFNCKNKTHHIIIKLHNCSVKDGMVDHESTEDSKSKFRKHLKYFLKEYVHNIHI